MGDSNKPRRSSSDDILVGKHEAVYAPVATLAEALGLRHDNLPRDELVAQTALAALQRIRRQRQIIRKLKQQALETAQELRGLRHQMLVAGGDYPSLYQIAHKLAHFSPPGVGREAGERLSVQAQRLDKGLRAIYENLEADHVS